MEEQVIKLFIRKPIEGLTKKEIHLMVKKMARQGYQWVGIQYGMYVFQAEVPATDKRTGLL